MYPHLSLENPENSENHLENPDYHENPENPEYLEDTISNLPYSRCQVHTPVIGQ